MRFLLSLIRNCFILSFILRFITVLLLSRLHYRFAESVFSPFTVLVVMFLVFTVIYWYILAFLFIFMIFFYLKSYCKNG